MSQIFEIVWRVFLTAIFGGACIFFLKLWEVRSHVRYLQRQGLPIPPHQWLLGHLPLGAKIVQGIAPYAHSIYIVDQVRQKYPALNSAFYLDIWLFGAPILAVLRPEMIYQLNQGTQTLPKDGGLRAFLSLQEWKYWRTIFNPDFRTTHICSLVPEIVDKVLDFKSSIEKKAKTGKSFLLEDLTLSLTIDIGGGAVMNHKSQSQTQYNDMSSALRHHITRINLLRPMIQAYNTWKMNRYSSLELGERYKSILGKTQNPGKSIVDLALKAYITENPATESIPKTLKDAAMAQIKPFLFESLQKTSNFVVFTYHLLSEHPEVLSKVRSEHDAVLGTVPSEEEILLRSKLQILNELSYTIAAIKEALRIYSLVFVIREGRSGFALRSEYGQLFPTKTCIIWGDHYATHHNPHVWSRPEEYLPERWLCSEIDPLYPPKNAWRPFEQGPRNCIGQELARKGNVGNMKVNGQRASMVRVGAGVRPTDGYPCRASFAQQGNSAQEGASHSNTGT
ncbi:cytochrome P450 [Melanomma pulvis-pyrius CBS 109.77]|uniref:Cytochrome P450 n=1 Tax=Melanomma pulvis-pyrius CBS 109.77 TaxID=1314802 RepID=A0A6A6WPT3_9PLEO|nr:cytochrome P450 [Melanomma pulvis-pyrius CBS 109.77]